MKLAGVRERTRLIEGPTEARSWVKDSRVEKTVDGGDRMRRSIFVCPRDGRPRSHRDRHGIKRQIDDAHRSSSRGGWLVCRLRFRYDAIFAADADLAGHHRMDLACVG